MIPIDRYHIDTAWGRLSYRRRGAGGPLLLLHSLALSGQMWDPVMGEFTAAHDVIAVDFRGHGDSQWDGAPFSVEELAADLSGLLDALSLGPCHVLGLSMGGSVALAFAAGYPDRVNRLVQCDTTAWYGPDAVDTWAKRAVTACSVPRENQVPFQTERWFSDRFRRTRPEVVSHVVGIFLRTGSHAHAQACRALGALDVRGRLDAISAPTLVITGEEDYATPASMGRTIAGGIPGAIFQEWPAVRHLSVFESAALRRQILNFLAGNPIEGAAGAPDACCDAAASAAPIRPAWQSAGQREADIR